MYNETIRTKSGLHIDRWFALSLLQTWCPELHWSPEESISAAEEAYCQEYDAPPDFEAMTKQSFMLPVRVGNFQEAALGGARDVLSRL